MVNSIRSPHHVWVIIALSITHILWGIGVILLPEIRTNVFVHDIARIFPTQWGLATVLLGFSFAALIGLGFAARQGGTNLVVILMIPQQFLATVSMFSLFYAMITGTVPEAPYTPRSVIYPVFCISIGLGLPHTFAIVDTAKGGALSEWISILLYRVFIRKVEALWRYGLSLVRR